MIGLSSIQRNSSVGVFATANDNTAFVSSSASESFKKDLAHALEVEVHATNVAETSLVGAMISMNNNGVLLPRNTTEREYSYFKDLGINFAVINDKPTALGNLILANDNGAVVSTHFSAAARKKIGDTLDVEVLAKSFKGFRTVGSIGIATSKGVLMHPNLDEEDLSYIENLLNVDVDIGTVNRGIGYVRTGVIANMNGAIIGKETTSPEISRIVDALGLL